MENQLKNKTILIVGAGGPSKRSILDKIRSFQVKIVIIDAKSSTSYENGQSHAAYLNDLGYFEECVWVDILDLENMAEDAVKQIKSRGIHVDGILCYWEDFVGVAAEIGQALNLKCNPPSSAHLARSKNLTRKTMKEKGLPTPVSILCKTVDDLENALDKCPFPAVVKPVYGAKAQGAVKVMDKDYAKAAFAYNQATLTPELDEIYAAGADCLLEQYLDGEEVDVDLLLENGQLKYWSITDNLPTLEPSFVHTGANLPSVLDKEKQDALVKLAHDTCMALGMTHGCFHVEAKYTTNSGPQIVEVNGRMAGSPYPDWIKEVWNVDLVKEQLYLAFDIPISPPKSEKPLCAMTLSWILSSGPSTLTSFQVSTFKKLEETSEDGLQVKVVFDVPEGYQYHQIGEEAIGYVQIKGPSISKCVAKFLDITDSTKFPIPNHLWIAGAELLPSISLPTKQRQERLSSIHEEQQERFEADMEKVRTKLGTSPLAFHFEDKRSQSLDSLNLGDHVVGSLESVGMMGRSRAASIVQEIEKLVLSTSPQVMESMEVYFNKSRGEV